MFQIALEKSFIRKPLPRHLDRCGR
jgi:hypothetical protein